jgi:hypothetical protein
MDELETVEDSTAGITPVSNINKSKGKELVSTTSLPQ